MIEANVLPLSQTANQSSALADFRYGGRFYGTLVIVNFYL